MAADTEDFIGKILEWAGRTNNVTNREMVKQAIRDEFEQQGNLVTDLADIPEGAGARANGAFFEDPTDLAEWLQIGGLLAFSANNGGPVAMSFVHIYETYDVDMDAYRYYVYIEDDS